MKYINQNLFFPRWARDFSDEEDYNDNDADTENYNLNFFNPEFWTTTLASTSAIEEEFKTGQWTCKPNHSHLNVIDGHT